LFYGGNRPEIFPVSLPILVAFVAFADQLVALVAFSVAAPIAADVSFAIWADIDVCAPITRNKPPIKVNAIQILVCDMDVKVVVEYINIVY
jgi:hypothetical protein